MTTRRHRLSSAPFGGNAVALRIGMWSVLLALGFSCLIATHALGANGSEVLRAQGTDGPVHVVSLDRPIDAVSERFLIRELALAESESAAIVVFILDTPGGFLESTRAMVSGMLDATIPTAVYISPSGAHAASAGTFIAASANILAMAPVTEIGAAAVVGGQGEDLSETLQTKANEDAAAMLRGIAVKRERNVEALEATVFEAKAYSAEEAVDMNVADVIVDDLNDLLAWLEGRTVETSTGEVTLTALGDGLLVERGYSIWDRLLAAIANPNLAYLFISLGGLGLIVELWNFGTFIPGTIGVMLLILGFAGVGQLPFQWAGLALILIALALFAAEIFVTPGFGFFGIAGAIALIFGGLFLFQLPGVEAPELPGGQVNVSLWLLLGVGAVVLAFTMWLVRELRVASRPESYISAGTSDCIVGQSAQVTRALEPEGEVYVAGEHWTGHTIDGKAVEVGQTVKVVAVEGVTLVVETDADE